jgi:hypothetical protein
VLRSGAYAALIALLLLALYLTLWFGLPRVIARRPTR